MKRDIDAMMMVFVVMACVFTIAYITVSCDVIGGLHMIGFALGFIGFMFITLKLLDWGGDLD